ncbi:hypothetical protein MPTK1_1g17710 [Marchantia polymorpha subsp. ruderalis]|uniref:Peptidyl-prolyl cis-trans isomerase n=2 Tax=Marchantia polymorpha TaxID=3197 RepID=A0A176WB71_MARPO|nr:hypothetical protein AXG93_773s1200 [Marchantia polymorpha subsp. ruderalis]PTQ50052.1 hypothetical protein MARPO_0001s0110 [Marchantia polymorpha]BBM98976.1 hypothetical protein Mp_1g17710 [Marchantia polymorpha subsp. ruderalis]|eukprot:PTQ50052.1 hypothetical protein MARPO_0001s0110 [Marchantia polymorpha]
MALTRDKRDLFFGVGALLALMALFQFLSYDLLIPAKDMPHKSKIEHFRRPHFMNATLVEKPARCRGALCTFMDITIKSDYVGQIVFLLNDIKRPKTAENFRALCTGEKGKSSSRTNLHYKGTAFSRVVHNILVQGGDIHKGKALEEEKESIYGAAFAQESNVDELHERGLLATAGRGKTGSEFFITLDSVAELDGQFVVFGEVVEGMDVVDKINSVAVNSDGEPTAPILISNSGQI